MWRTLKGMPEDSMTDAEKKAARLQKARELAAEKLAAANGGGGAEKSAFPR